MGDTGGRGLTEKQLQHFYKYGYIVLDDVLSSIELEELRQEANELVDLVYNNEKDVLEDCGCIIEPTLRIDSSANANIYQDYISNADVYQRLRSPNRPSIVKLVSSKLAFFAASLFQGRDIHLLNEQYIIKPPMTTVKAGFAWHKDANYLPLSLQQIPTIACWVALDNMSSENGNLDVHPFKHSLPFSNIHSYADYKRFFGHMQTRAVAYEDDTKLEQRSITMSAGSVLVMSSAIYHRSGGNSSRRYRRAFMPQYCVESLRDATSKKLVAMNVPCFL